MNRHTTFIRYFISYLIILLLSLTGFTIIIQTQLTKIYSNQLSANVDNRLTVAQDQFFGNLESILQIHAQLRQDMALSDYRNDPTSANRYALYQQLRRYDISNDFIGSIIYLNRTNNDTLSSNYVVHCKDDVCYIRDYRGNCEAFSMKNHALIEKNTLFLLSEDNPLYLLYLPKDTGTSYSLIYLIELAELAKILENNQIDGMNAFAFANSDYSLLYGINTEELMSVSSDFPAETGIYPSGREYSLYIHSNIYENFSLIALYSTHAFSNQAHAAFRTVYYLLPLIGLVGFILIFFSMKLTYFPLANFVQKVVPKSEFSSSQGFIEQLNNVFSTNTTEREQLQKKIDKYHLSILNSLLNSGIDDSRKFSFSNIKDIDQIFRTDCSNHIYMIRIHSKASSIPDEKIQLFWKSMLPEGSVSFMLESGKDYKVYVINYIGLDFEKDDIIYSLMEDLYRKYGCYCAISSSVSSLTDIPPLYEDTLLASQLWPDSPVAAYSEALRSNVDDSVYPYKLLNRFSENLNRLDFSEAQELLARLLQQIDHLSSPNSNYPNFVIRCLLIDILMVLIDSMNQRDIKFAHYKDLYLETLYFCRTFNWQEKESEITDNLLKLLELFQSEQQMIRNYQIQEYLEQHFSSEDLTITVLAEHFHVSLAYMSYLFKKEFGVNFSDYLWNLRFQKAADMLLHTDLTIDAISIYVGYVNPSSFRRKFKQETGVTPSQYRDRDKP
jgi:AraC-like DNA-binding protein